MKRIALLALFATQIAATPEPDFELQDVPAEPATAEQAWPGAQPHAERLADQVVQGALRGDRWTLAKLLRLSNFNHLHNAPAELERATLAVIEAPRLSALTKDHAHYLRAQLRRAQGQTEAAERSLQRLGFVREGLYLGPFDNPAGAGHQTMLGPQLSADPRAPAQGRQGPIAWNSLEHRAPFGVIHLSELVYPSVEATAFVATAVRCDKKMQAALRIGSTDAVRAWVNGREVIDSQARRFAALDQDAALVSLEAGLNLLVFKVSWTEELGQLLARLTQPQGGPLAGAQIDGGTEAVMQALAAHPLRPEPGPPPLSKSLATVRTGLEAPKSPQDFALLADLVAVLGLYDSLKRPTEPEQLLIQAIRRAASDPRLRFFLAHRIRDLDPSRARTLLQDALRSDPGYVPALLALSELDRGAGHALHARAHLDEAITMDPTFGAAHLARAALGFEQLDEEALALDRLKRSLDRDEVLGRQVNLHVQMSQMQRSLGDYAGARASADRALALDATHELARSLATDLALDARDEAAARSHLDAALTARPFSLHPRLQLARVLAGTPGQLEAAIQLLKQTSLLFAQNPRVWSQLAELYLFAGQPAEALAALNQARTLDPHQPELRRHQRALSGEQLELEEQYGVDAAALVQRPPSAAEKRFGAAYLSDRKVIRLFQDGRSVRFQQSILRLFNPQLEDALRAHRIDYAPSRESVQILAAERIRPNGEVSAATMVRDEGPGGKVSGMYVDQRYKLVLFDDLEAGDLVHLKYRVDSIGANIFGGFFGDVTAVQGALPKEAFFYQVMTPKDRPLYEAEVRAPPATRSQSGSDQALTWTLTDVPGLDMEPLSAPYPDIGRLISVSTYKDWDALGAWYGRLYAPQMELDDAARQAGKDAVGAVTDVPEKVRRLYGYVVKNTRYVGIELGIHGWKPFSASEVHRRRYGDCKDKATLLAALLRDNGIEAALTLVRTSDRGTLPDGHATMWAFNHAITYVPALDLFLDPTAEFNGSTELPYLDQGAMALVVHPDGRTRRVTLPVSKPEDNLNASQYEAVLSPDTRLELTGTERFLGARAADLRREMQEPDDRVRLLEAPLSEIFPGVKVEEASFSNLDDLEAEVSYRYRFTVPRYGRLDAHTLSFPVALYRHQVAAAYAQLTTRQYAVHTPYAWKTQNVVRYHLPNNAQLEVLPEGLTIDTPHIALLQKIRRTEGGFETDDTVILKTRIVPPQDYPAFREACLAIDRAMARKVVIKW